MSGMQLFFVVLYAAILTLPAMYAWEHRGVFTRAVARIARRAAR